MAEVLHSALLSRETIWSKWTLCITLVIMITLLKESATADIKSSLHKSSRDPSCPPLQFRMRDKTIVKMDDLLKFFSYYSLIPKFSQSAGLVSFDVIVKKPSCSVFKQNVTLYVRPGTVDMKAFKYVFHEEAYRFLKKHYKTSPKTILDLGAHTGLVSLYLANIFSNATVVAVEPSLSNFALLRLNTARINRVYAEYGAVWDKTSTVKFGTTGNRDSSVWTKFVDDVIDLTTGSLGDIVPAMSLNDIVGKFKWSSIDLVHADLNGAERIVFGDTNAKFWLRKVKCIIVRLRGQNGYAISKVFGQLSTSQSKLVKKTRSGDIQLWCRENVTSVKGG